MRFPAASITKQLKKFILTIWLCLIPSALSSNYNWLAQEPFWKNGGKLSLLVATKLEEGKLRCWSIRQFFSKLCFLKLELLKLVLAMCSWPIKAILAFLTVKRKSNGKGWWARKWRTVFSFFLYIRHIAGWCLLKYRKCHQVNNTVVNSSALRHHLPFQD
jgi:hypothetical protein